MEYNLQRFKQRQGIKDMDLYVKLKDYMLHSLLPHGIMKSDDTQETIYERQQNSNASE
jgi:hypothetical protein